MGDGRKLKRILGSGAAIIAALSLAIPAGAATVSEPAGDDTAEAAQLDGEEAKGNEFIGYINESYVRAQHNGIVTQRAESTLANFVAEQMRATLAERFGGSHPIDFVLFDPNLLKADLIYKYDPVNDWGAVYRQNIVDLFETTNTKVTLIELSGEKLIEVLEQQYGFVHGHNPTRLGISITLQYVYDYTPPGGPDGAQVTVVPYWAMHNGEFPIIAVERYKVAVPAHLLTDTPSNRFKSLIGAKVLLDDVGVTWAQAVEARIKKAYPGALIYYPRQHSVGYTWAEFLGANIMETDLTESGKMFGGLFWSLYFLGNELTDQNSVIEAWFKDYGTNRWRVIGRYPIMVIDEGHDWDSQGGAFVRFVLPPLDSAATGVLALTIGGIPVVHRNYTVERDPNYHGYVDVRESDHFAKEIDWLTYAGISTGWNAGPGKYRFERYRPVLRDQMAAFLYRFKQLLTPDEPYLGPETSPFTDVPTSHVFYNEICWLYSEGISTGWEMQDGTRQFRPYQPVLRDQMAAFLFRWAKRYESPMGEAYIGKSYFTDMDPTRFFNTEAQWLYHYRISTGWKVGESYEFRPYQPVLRDQMAAFIYRIYANGMAFTADSNWYSG